MKILKVAPLLLAGFVGQVSTAAEEEALTDWFSKAEDKRGNLPKVVLDAKLDSPEAIEQARGSVWKAYRAGAIKRGWDQAIPAEPGGMEDWVKENQINPRKIEIGDKTMLYVVLAKGKKPKGGWPVFFCLHGGGGNAKAKGPHTWQVNTREWFAQMQLTTKLWESPGLYIIPRMADDRQGRWYYRWNQVFIDRLTQQAILFNDANPDRVYLEGISEGGYSAFRLGSLMADRWAGSCALAAAEPIGNAPIENLRHVAFRCGIGENDKMFDRIGLARNYFKKMGELKKEHPDDFNFFFDEQKGRGHGIDYREGPAWVYQFTRTAVPKGFNWTVIKQHDLHRDRMYWLALDESPSSLPLKLTARANKESNTVSITAEDKDGENAREIRLRIYLNEDLVDLDKEVTITINGKDGFKGVVKPSMEALIRSTAERGDPKQVFPAQVKLRF